MGGPSRYDVSDNEAGIENGVLRNKLKIGSQKDLDDVETVLLLDAQTHFFDRLSQGDIKFGLPLLFDIHKYFLGTLYEWAGKLRTVDISKGGMRFASTAYLEGTMRDFDALLKKELPKKSDSPKIVSEKIAVIHNEFNAIHPYREGNGRTIRLFLDLLVANLGFQLIDWGSKLSYFAACREGMIRNHSAMAKIIRLKRAAK